MAIDLALITGGLDPWIAGALFLVSFLSSFITIAFGIGGGIFLLAIMASLVPPAALIPVHGVIQLGSNFFRAGLLLRQVHWPSVKGFVAGAILGVTLGGLVAVELPPALVTTGIGCFVIYTVFAKAPAWLGRSSLIAGGVSSFLTMFFGATGPFVAVYLKTLNLGRQAHVATHATFMTFQHSLKVITFGVLGFAFAPWVGFIAMMMVFGVLGTLAGRLLLIRMSDHGFKRALDVVLVLLSLRLIWSGISVLL